MQPDWGSVPEWFAVAVLLLGAAALLLFVRFVRNEVRATAASLRQLVADQRSSIYAGESTGSARAADTEAQRRRTDAAFASLNTSLVEIRDAILQSAEQPDGTPPAPPPRDDGPSIWDDRQHAAGAPTGQDGAASANQSGPDAGDVRVLCTRVYVRIVALEPDDPDRRLVVDGLGDHLPEIITVALEGREQVRDPEVADAQLHVVHGKWADGDLDGAIVAALGVITLTLLSGGAGALSAAAAGDALGREALKALITGAVGALGGVAVAKGTEIYNRPPAPEPTGRASVAPAQSTDAADTRPAAVRDGTGRPADQPQTTRVTGIRRIARSAEPPDAERQGDEPVPAAETVEPDLLGGMNRTINEQEAEVAPPPDVISRVKRSGGLPGPSVPAPHRRRGPGRS